MKKILILTALGLFLTAHSAAGIATSFVPTAAMACGGAGCN
jgi:hypothetical protein